MKRPSDEEIRTRAKAENLIQQKYKGDTIIDVAMHVANWAMDQMAKQEPKMGGILTFEEWHKVYYGRNHSQNKELIEMVWNIARADMIPAANAIQIPDESEWPEWSQGIRIQHQGIKSDHWSIIKDIPRSKPAWKPCEGDIVAAWDHDKSGIIIATVASEGKASGIYDKDDNHWCHCAKLEQLSDIGHDIAWFKANRNWI